MPTRKIAPFVGYTVTTTGTADYEIPDANLLKNETGNEGLHSQLLRDVYADATTGICYAIYNEDDYEIGLGTLDSTPTPNVLERTTILESTNADEKVSWGAGTRVLVVTPYPPDISLLSNNLEGLASAATARSNLGSTTVGDDLFTAASASAARSTLGLGSAAVEDAATAATADTVALRDGAGQLKSADPTANDDVATKGWSDSTFQPLGVAEDQIVIGGQSGGTSGKVIRQSAANAWTNAANTDTTAQLGTVAFQESGTYVLRGVVTLSGVAQGTNYYLSTSGNVTSTAPTPDGSTRLLYVGRGVATNTLLFDPHPPIGG